MKQTSDEKLFADLVGFSPEYKAELELLEHVLGCRTKALNYFLTGRESVAEGSNVSSKKVQN